MDSTEVSLRFLEFYKAQGFLPLPRASLLDPSVPMSFVMSAGLVQIENILSKTNGHSGEKYVLTQKCFRHFDVDKVGTDDLHLSFFEMPGAFVFGDSSRFETIQNMWFVLTKVLSLDPERLWVTYFAGECTTEHCFRTDILTYNAWLDTGFSPEHITALGPEHNLWIQGNGISNRQERYHKCGPNTEVFWDRGSRHSCGATCRPGCRCGRFLEIANSLFISMQTDVETGSIIPLEEPFVETVIGTERIAMITQNKASVFEIDAFNPLTTLIASFCDFQDPRAQKYQKEIYVIADHIRALIFLTADGAPPPWGENGNKGGRYRLIRILIRRVLSALIVLNIESEPFLPTIVDVAIKESGEFDRLILARDTLLRYFRGESERFNRTLDHARLHLNGFLQNWSGELFPGKQAIDLEKSCGIPKNIIEYELECYGLKLDDHDYNNALRAFQEDHNVKSVKRS